MTNLEKLIELISEARRDGWYEECSRWREVEELLDFVNPKWRDG